MLKPKTSILLPDGRTAEVLRVSSSSAYVRPYSVRRDKSIGGKNKRRKFYESPFHISNESEVEVL